MSREVLRPYASAGSLRAVSYAAPGAENSPADSGEESDDSQASESGKPWAKVLENHFLWRHFKWICIYPMTAGQVGYPIWLWCSGVAAGAFAIYNAIFLLVCGLFMWSNASLFASMLSLWHEISRFRHTNEKFGEDLEQQGLIIRRLQKTGDAFKQIDIKYKGSVQHAQQQIPELQNNVAMKLTNNVRDICMMYTDTMGKKRFLDAGEELDHTFEVFSDIFSETIPDYDQRMQSTQKTLFESDTYQNDSKGVSVAALTDLMQIALTEPSLANIKPRVEKYIAENPLKKCVP